MAGTPVRRLAARVRVGHRRALDATLPLEAGEHVLVEWRIARGGDWIQHHGYLRVTDRRVLILVGRGPGRDEVVEIPRSLVRVRAAPAGDPIIRLEVAAPVDDDLLAFRAADWVVPSDGSRFHLRIRAEGVRTGQLRELLLLALGPVDAAVPEARG